MATDNNRLCIIDMGSAHVATVIAEIHPDNTIEVLGFGYSQNRGMQRGSIIDMDKLVASIKQSVAYAEDMADCRVHQAWLSVSNASLKSFNCSGRAMVEHVQVTTNDIVKTLAVAKQENQLDDYYLVNHFLHGISINQNEEMTMSPLSMLADEIEAFYHMMMLPVTLMQNLEQAMGLANLHIEKTLISNIASSSYALLAEERLQGVCCVDIGAGTTNLSVYCEDKLLLTKSLPVGGYDITRDIAAELRISIEEAEKLKLVYGKVNLEDIDFSRMLPVPAHDGMSASTVSARELGEIMAARYEEILLAVLNTIEEEGLLSVLNRGFVYCGGASQVYNFTRFANRITNHSAQMANFSQQIYVDQALKRKLDSYQYHSVLGALIYSNSEQFSINQQSELIEENQGVLHKTIVQPFSNFIKFLSGIF